MNRAVIAETELVTAGQASYCPYCESRSVRQLKGREVKQFIVLARPLRCLTCGAEFPAPTHRSLGATAIVVGLLLAGGAIWFGIQEGRTLAAHPGWGGAYRLLTDCYFAFAGLWLARLGFNGIRFTRLYRARSPAKGGVSR